MKRLIFIWTLLCTATLFLFADEQKDVFLNNDHNEETITLPYLCNIFVRMKVEDEDKAIVSLAIENLNEEKSLILFDRCYEEKTLKKLYPKIYFHKIFGGSKGKRMADAYSKLSQVIRLHPSDKRILIDKEMQNGEHATLRLPVYIAKYKGRRRRKMYLLEKHIVEVNLQVELKPDEDYIRLSAGIDDFIKRLEEKPFCTHRNHIAGIEEQERPYEEERDGMLQAIDSIVISHSNWFKGDKGYERYDSLRVRLQRIEFSDYRTDNCGIVRLHRNAGHRCRYCNLTLAQIYHRLDDYYQKIYSSSDRKATKEAVMGDVNLLYRCCTDIRCQRHAAAWKKGGDYKNKIVERYNRISEL